MTRYKFGGTLFDFVDSSTKIQNIDVLTPTAATVSLWTDKTGGTQITDLLDSSSSPISVVAVQSDGNIPDFFGPDGVTSMYASADGGPRLAIVSWHAAADAVSSAEAAANSDSDSETSAASSATAAQTAAQQAQAPTDSMVANLIATPSSATASGLNSAFVGYSRDRGRLTDHAAEVLETVDMGLRSSAIGVVTDSTGFSASANRGGYLLGQRLAALYPAYTVQHRAWNPASNEYDAPTVLQTGTGNGGGERYATYAATSSTTPSRPDPVPCAA